MAAKNIEFTVHGRPVSVEPIEGEMLADLLRDRLRLTGVKIGCNENECGPARWFIDGEPVLSCNYPAVKAQVKTSPPSRGWRVKSHPPTCTRCRMPSSNTARSNADSASLGS